MTISPHREHDASAALSHACCLRLSAAGLDAFASCLLPPNLVRVWRADADAAVIRLARRHHWPRVRLLFVAHREAGESPPSGAEADGAGAGEAGDVPAIVARGGSLFALLDRELLWLIAEWLVNIEAAVSV